MSIGLTPQSADKSYQNFSTSQLATSQRKAVIDDLSVDVLRATSTSISGDFTVPGTLTVDTGLAVQGNAVVRGATVIDGTLEVAGATTLSDTTLNGPMQINGTLSSGATTLNGTLTVQDAVTLSGGFASATAFITGTTNSSLVMTQSTTSPITSIQVATVTQIGNVAFYQIQGNVASPPTSGGFPIGYLVAPFQPPANFSGVMGIGILYFANNVSIPLFVSDIVSNAVIITYTKSGAGGTGDGVFTVSFSLTL